MRTNVVLNDELVAEAMRYSTARSKSALLEEALRAYVEMHEAQQRRKSYEERLSGLRHRLDSLRLREAPRSVLRRDRDR